MSMRVKHGKVQSSHVHSYVMDLARDLCMASYEAAMGNNFVRASWKAKYPEKTERELQVAWLLKHQAAHVAPARAILAGMLGSIDDPHLQETIHRALILDNMLVRGRNPPSASR